MQKEVKVRIIKHITFLEGELKDYDIFQTLTWKEYMIDRSKRRNVERWIENIINSSIDIAKIVLTSEAIPLSDTYKGIVASLSLVPDFAEKDMETLSNWVRLRNIISHEYLDIRWTSIKRFIAETKSLYEGFLIKVKGYIEKKEQENDLRI